MTRPDKYVTRCGACGAWAILYTPCAGCDRDEVLTPYRRWL